MRPIVLRPLSASFQEGKYSKSNRCSKVATGSSCLYCLDVMFPFDLCLAVLYGGSLGGFCWVRIGCPVVRIDLIASVCCLGGTETFDRAGDVAL